ncbi:MAG: hypothetical protein SBU_000533 [Candidatus Syntrophoarchaeum butanivorans]|uniref:Uncharacterized protein n=1 Tax=Candidatus Syntropharchaeum butanivorans TaxID=1839936 RepID=A0A1F2P7K2_9EURY|nr:MAG: hypothetical protein SBU_000533 [Candidatus Syntrophoarchaeum butanivorans]
MGLTQEITGIKQPDITEKSSDKTKRWFYCSCIMVLIHNCCIEHITLSSRMKKIHGTAGVPLRCTGMLEVAWVITRIQIIS